MSDASQVARMPPTCPECDSNLREVGMKTVKHVLRYELARVVAPGRFLYCEDPGCAVAYLRVSPSDPSTISEIFHRHDLKDRVRPSAVGRERLVCHCFGYTVGDIQDDAREGRDLIPGAIAAEVKAGLCACEVMNPKGG